MNWHKIFLNGLFTMITTFLTAFISHATELGPGADFSALSPITWAVMGSGAVIAGIAQWKGFLTSPPPIKRVNHDPL